MNGGKYEKHQDADKCRDGEGFFHRFTEMECLHSKDEGLGLKS